MRLSSAAWWKTSRPAPWGAFCKEADRKPPRSIDWLNHQRAQHPAAFDAAVKALCETYRQAPVRHEQGVHTVSGEDKTGMQALERLPPTRPMKPGVLERWEYEYKRYGPLPLIANFEGATGHVSAPTLGPTRPEEDCARHLAATLATDPPAPWIFVMDQLHSHTSESLARLVAERCDLAIDLGVKGQSGILKSLPPRAACLTDKTHRIRFVYTPKHTAWLHQVEIWFSILSRRLLKRASFTSIEELQERVLAFSAYFNATLAKPFKWTYKGRPLSA